MKQAELQGPGESARESLTLGLMSFLFLITCQPVSKILIGLRIDLEFVEKTHLPVGVRR